MEYINNKINDLNEEKIIIPKKNYYCSNCNKRGHTYKICNEPIISNGIIAIYINNFNKLLLPKLEEYINNNLKIFTNIYNKNSSVIFNNKNNIISIESKVINNDFNENIKFLMVQRKNSLGYLEFMRGRYILDDKISIIHLLEQMTPEELQDIINIDFDELWNNLWDSNNIRNKNHHKEYITSKQKFYQLKLTNFNLIKNTKNLFTFNEWGFPKGRRELYESDLVCAIREFEEETFIPEDKYIILEKCKSIRENLVGTNSINYAHNYFLAILNETKSSYDENNREIGDLKIMNLNECLKSIRPYHKNKIRIIKKIYQIVNNFLNEYKDEKNIL